MMLPYPQPVLHGPLPPVWEDSQPPKIKHVISGKWLVLTPEEWVRQNLLLHFAAIGYPLSLITTERLIKVGTTKRRFDVVVYLSDLTPFLITECKAQHEPLSLSTHLQAAEYNSALRAQYMLVTNGVDSRVFRLEQGIHYAEPSLPAYPK